MNRKYIYWGVGGVAALVAGYFLIVLLIGFFSPRKANRILTYVPFKEFKDDRWGLMDLKGGILCEKEWENQPSLAVEGLVRVKAADGLYELFSATAKPRQVGEKYKACTLPYEGLAAVVKENASISYIDTTGKTVFDLKEAGGAAVEEAGCFSEGLARFRTAEGKWGFADRKGQVAIKPQYSAAANFSEGLARVELEDVKADGSRTTRRGLIDKAGVEVIKLNSDYRYGDCLESLISFTDNDGKEWGFMDRRGDKIVKPTRNFRRVMPFNEGYASFYDGAKTGLIDRKGEIVIRAKYDVAFYSNGLVLVKDGEKWGYRDLNDREVIKTDFNEAFPFFGDATVVKDRSKYILINRKGDPIDKKDYAAIAGMDDFMENLFGNCGSETVESDLFDVAAIANAVISNLNRKQINGFTGETTAAEVMKKFNLREGDVASYSREITVRDQKVNAAASYTAVFSFSDAVLAGAATDPGTPAPPAARLVAVKYTVSLTGRGAAKQKDLLESFKQKFGGAQFSADAARGSETMAFYLDDQKNPLASVSCSPAQVEINMRLQSMTETAVPAVTPQ